MRRALRENGLSIVLLSLFLLFWLGQSVAGHREHNSEQREHLQSELAYSTYLQSAHFWEATAENWESEFFQMYGYVILTAILYQKGSSESKKPDEPEPVDRDPRRSKKRDAPWPVRRGGLVLKLYENSLSLAFLLFFLVSIAMHAVAGARVYNEDQAAHGLPVHLSFLQYSGTSRFWFESFQNWQSEFLAMLAMVVLSIFLRRAGRPSPSRWTVPTTKPVVIEHFTRVPAPPASAPAAGIDPLFPHPGCSPGFRSGTTESPARTGRSSSWPRSLPDPSS